MALSTSNISSTINNAKSSAKDSVKNATSLSGGPSSISNPITDATKNVQDKIDSVTSKVEGTLNDVSGAVSDPFGAIIQVSLKKINSLTVNIEKKVDQLVKEVVQKTDSKGRVSLEGSMLVITVRREDLAQAQELQKRVQDKIKSIKKTIEILRTTLNTLISIKTAISTYKTLLDLQEISLSLNPATGPIFLILKKGIKIIFLKEIINEYVKILGRQLLQNQEVLNRLINKFRNIQVSIKIQDESDKGNYVSTDIAEQLLADDQLGDGVSSDYQDFTDNSFNQYILKVEKYDSKQLIARAIEKESGMIKAQTAPSYFATPEELMEELKTILNIGI